MRDLDQFLAEHTQRTETIALANSKCVRCAGLGTSKNSACKCVYRRIFRVCLNRWRRIQGQTVPVTCVRFDRVQPGGGGRRTWGNKDREYCADFELVARRSLTEQENRIFRLHYLAGADYNLCCRRVKIDKGNFFHAIYRIEEKLGRVFRHMKPYALFPLDEYFAGVQTKGTATALKVVEKPARKLSSHVPLKAA